MRFLKQWFPSYGNCPGISCWEKEKTGAWCQAEGKFVSRKEILHGSDNLSDRDAEDTGAETMMVQRWAGPHLDQDGSVMQTSFSLLKTNFMTEP